MYVGNCHLFMSHEWTKLHVRPAGRSAIRGGSLVDVVSFGKVKALRGHTLSGMQRVGVESTPALLPLEALDPDICCMGNCSMRRKCSPAPTWKSQWV